MFGAEALPHKKYLDEIFPNRPFSLRVMTAYLLGQFEGPCSGRDHKRNSGSAKRTIVRDPKTGEATGALKESAQDLVAKIIPKPSRVEKLLALRAGMKWANQHGITRVHSAGQDFEALDLFDEMRHRGDLTVRMYIAYFLNPPSSGMRTSTPSNTPTRNSTMTGSTPAPSNSWWMASSNRTPRQCSSHTATIPP